MLLDPCEIVLIERKRDIHGIPGQDQAIGYRDRSLLVSQADHLALPELKNRMNLLRVFIFHIHCSAERSVRKRHFDARRIQLDTYFIRIIGKVYNGAGSKLPKGKRCLYRGSAHPVFAREAGTDQININDIRLSPDSVKTIINDRFQKLFFVCDQRSRFHVRQDTVRNVCFQKCIQLAGLKVQQEIQITGIPHGSIDPCLVSSGYHAGNPIV